jgi:hypothetical protein
VLQGQMSLGDLNATAAAMYRHCSHHKLLLLLLLLLGTGQCWCCRVRCFWVTSMPLLQQCIDTAHTINCYCCCCCCQVRGSAGAAGSGVSG